MRNVKIILLLFLASVTLSGCLKISTNNIQATLSGYVSTDPLDAIVNTQDAIVYVEGYDQSARTNADGSFVFTATKSSSNRIITVIKTESGTQITLKGMGDVRQGNTEVVQVNPITTIAVAAVEAIGERSLFPFSEIVGLVSSDATFLDESLTLIASGQTHKIDPTPLLNKLLLFYVPVDQVGTLDYRYTTWNGVEVTEDHPTERVEKTGNTQNINDVTVYEATVTFDDQVNPPEVTVVWQGVADGRYTLYDEVPATPNRVYPYHALALKKNDSARKGPLEYDTVSVTAGVFDALKVTASIGGNTHIVWYAPGIGVVQHDVYQGGNLYSRKELVAVY